MVDDLGTAPWTAPLAGEERTRLAPTPSGFLHRGNAINFLLTQLLAKVRGARVLLRIDDLDAERVRSEYVEDLFASLVWLDITWDEGPRDPEDLRWKWSQTRRMAAYQRTIENLRSGGHLYACRCSRTELRDLSELGRNRCECLTSKHPFEGSGTAWRLHIPDGTVVDLPELGGGIRKVVLDEVITPPVIRQKDGSPSYQVASLTDDEAYGTTFLVRGEDLLPSTACQRYLAQLLDHQTFLRVRSWHHPLVCDERGMKLSKSEGADSLRSMRNGGMDSGALHRMAERMMIQIPSHRP